MLDTYNMSLGSGLSKLAGKVFRIGHLGECNELTLMGALSGVEMGLAAAGVPHRAGGVEAAMQSLEGADPVEFPDAPEGGQDLTGAKIWQGQRHCATSRGPRDARMSCIPGFGFARQRPPSYALTAPAGRGTSPPNSDIRPLPNQENTGKDAT